MDRAVSSIFVLGRAPSRSSDERSRISEPISLASLSYEELGGVEYSALRVLLKIVAGRSQSFFFSPFMYNADADRLLLWSAPAWRTVSVAMDLDREPKVLGVSPLAGPRQHLVVRIHTVLGLICTDSINLGPSTLRKR